MLHFFFFFQVWIENVMDEQTDGRKSKNPKVRSVFVPVLLLTFLLTGSVHAASPFC